MRSKNARASSATKSGVNSRLPFSLTVMDEPRKSSVIGITRRIRVRILLSSGCSVVSVWRAMRMPVMIRNAPKMNGIHQNASSSAPPMPIRTPRRTIAMITPQNRAR